MTQLRCPALFLSASLIAVLATCAKVPRESVLLSEELGGMIGSARASHLALVEGYVREKCNRVDDFIRNEWTPAFMETYVPLSGVLDSIASAPTVARKGERMLQFAEAALKEISQVREAKIKALEEIERLLKREIDQHYASMHLVNQALTAHLKSAADITELREDLAARLGLDFDEILPIDEINERFEKLLTTGETIEEVVGTAESFPEFIRELLAKEGE